MGDPKHEKHSIVHAREENAIVYPNFKSILVDYHVSDGEGVEWFAVAKVVQDMDDLGPPMKSHTERTFKSVARVHNLRGEVNLFPSGF